MPLTPEKRQEVRARVQQFAESLKAPNYGRRRDGLDCHCDEALVGPENIPDGRAVDAEDPPALEAEEGEAILARREERHSKRIIEQLRHEEPEEDKWFECIDRPGWGVLQCKEMALRFGIKPGELMFSARKCHRIQGLRVVKFGHGWIEPPPGRRKKFAVECVERPEWGPFPSIKDAANRARVARTAITEATQVGIRAGGLHWKRLDGQGWQKSQEDPKPPRDKPVYDRIEDRRFRSILHAAKYAARVENGGKMPFARAVHRWNKRITTELARASGRWEFVKEQSSVAA